MHLLLGPKVCHVHHDSIVVFSTSRKKRSEKRIENRRKSIRPHPALTANFENVASKSAPAWLERRGFIVIERIRVFLASGRGRSSRLAATDHHDGGMDVAHRHRWRRAWGQWQWRRPVGRVQLHRGDRRRRRLAGPDIVDALGSHDTVHAVAGRAEDAPTRRVATLPQQLHQQRLGHGRRL